MSRSLAIACLLGGCNPVFGLDPTRLAFDAGPDQAVDGPGCSDGIFSGAVFLDELGPVPEFEPALRHDLREVWFTLLDTPNTLWVTNRGASTGPFDPPRPAPFASAQGEQAAALTGDGLRILFLSSRSGALEIWETTRAAIEDEFPTTATMLMGLAPYAIESFDVSFDGRTIYFIDLLSQSSGAVFEATRPAFDQPFGAARQVADPSRSVSISPDGLELFYNPRGENRLLRKTRASTDGVFGEERMLADEGYDPDLAPTSMTLIISLNSGVGVMNRMCP